MCVGISRPICGLIDVFLLFGICLVISILVAKLYRIYRIFQNRSAEAVYITDKHLFVFAGLISLVCCILFILYDTLGGGLKPVKKIASSNPLYTFDICQVPNSTVQTTFVIIFFIYFISIFVLAGILAFLTRKTMREYNESFDVGTVAYTWLAIATIYAPIYYLQGDSTNSNQTRVVVRFIAITITLILTLGILFWDKVSRIISSERRSRRHPERERPEIELNRN